MKPPNLRSKTVVASIVKQHHWRAGKSIRSIEREMGLGKTTLANWCKRHEIAVRTKVAQIAISHKTIRRRRGKDHWAWGMRKETSEFFQRQSSRMSSANPSRDPAASSAR